MKNNINRFLTLMLFFLVIFPAASSGLIVPEKLEYDLTLADINVGKMSFETSKMGPSVQLESSATSAAWVSVFYQVDDHAVSLLENSQLPGLPETFPFVPVSSKVSIHEGPNRAKKEFAFDYTNKRIRYSDELKNEKADLLMKGLTFDALSALFYIRHLELTPGASFTVNIFNKKMFYKTKVQVLKKESLHTAFGKLDTILLKTNMDEAGDGVFYYPGEIYIWLTDDEKRTPVLIEKKLKPLLEGKIPDLIKKAMPDSLLEKITGASVRAVIVRKQEVSK